LATEAGAGKVELIEFFWYSCPHCHAFEPAFGQWVKNAPKDVVVRRIPVSFRDDFAPQQRLFFTLEAMNLLDSLHVKVFNAVHVEKQPLNTDASILAWAQKQGVDKAKFEETYKSFGVASKLKRAVQLQNDFKVEGVPSLGIAGRYYTDGSLAGNMDRALKVAESLIAQTRQGR
jgi:thiol:disulfide interchange protein DsbA